jgi:hypothetical protein
MPFFGAGTTRGARPLEHAAQQGVDVVIVRRRAARDPLGRDRRDAALGSGVDAGGMGPTPVMPSWARP